jgi:hypothetical protein
MKSEDVVVGGSIVDGQLFLSYAIISRPLFVIQCKWFSSPFRSEQGTVLFKAAEIIRADDEFFGTESISFTVDHLNPSAELDPEHPELGQWPVGAAYPWLQRWLQGNERLLNKDYFQKS